MNDPYVHLMTLDHDRRLTLMAERRRTQLDAVDRARGTAGLRRNDHEFALSSQ